MALNRLPDHDLFDKPDLALVAASIDLIMEVCDVYGDKINPLISDSTLLGKHDRSYIRFILIYIF